MEISILTILLAFPAFSTQNRLLVVNSKQNEMLSQFSHALPGHSSMTIIRTFSRPQPPTFSRPQTPTFSRPQPPTFSSYIENQSSVSTPFQSLLHKPLQTSPQEQRNSFFSHPSPVSLDRSAPTKTRAISSESSSQESFSSLLHEPEEYGASPALLQYTSLNNEFKQSKETNPPLLKVEVYHAPLNQVLPTNMNKHPYQTNFDLHTVETPRNLFNEPVEEGGMRISFSKHSIIDSELLQGDPLAYSEEEIMNDDHDMLIKNDDTSSIPGPFAPRFKIDKWEVPEDEAKLEIEDNFLNTGLVPGVLPTVPGGLVNINYGLHACVHLGSELSPNQTANPPTRISFPSKPENYYTLAMIDAESRNLHWLIVNIPGGKVDQGNVIAVYQPPSSKYSTGMHHYVAVALVQQEGAFFNGLEDYMASTCDWKNRENFEISRLMNRFSLNIIAGNFLRSMHDYEFSEQFCNYSYL